MRLCYEGLTGKVVTPCSQEYEEARQEWNWAIQKFPIVIVYCYTIEDVSNAVCWARCHGIGIRIRSGGHHYEGYSTGDNILVIDVSQMKLIRLNEADNTLMVQSGVTNEQLYNYVGSRGYPFPGGTCPTVGVAGYVLGGGWGYSSRYMGLGCDNLLELEMVNDQGNVLKVNEKCNPNLFWACKGAGGGNFGIVTSMTFQLPPKTDQVTLIGLQYVNTSLSTRMQFLDIWQNWLVNLDDRITINASIYNSPDRGIGIFGKGLFYGSSVEAAQILQPFEQIQGATINVQEMTFLEAVHKIQEVYPDSEKFQSTGRFVDRQYNMEEIKNIVELIDQRAEGSVFATVSVSALGGKIRAVNKMDTAYYYRDAAYIISIQSVWEDNQYAFLNRNWLYQKFEYLKGITNGSYINFPYSYLIDYETNYYGENTCRLQQINKHYDPMDVFHFPQSIR
ncbi:FAD-dependent oxidoreductase [Clostridium aminobutyricum]|nr:FAD-dependent oxidoreductase [Clostridium aminobutyricum]